MIVVFATSAGDAAEDLRVGAAAVVITPPVGTPMAGYYFERAAEGVHDDLFAKALVLEQGETKAALVSLDLISTPFGMVEAAREEIERATGIPGRNVMISATHAHTGPVLAGRGLRDDALGGGTTWSAATPPPCRPGSPRPCARADPPWRRPSRGRRRARSTRSPSTGDST